MHRWLVAPVVAVLSLVSCSRDSASSPPSDRRLTHTARLELRVDDPSDSEAQARQVAESLGGFVANSSVVEGDAVTMTLRVPARSLEAALSGLSAFGAVDEKRVEGTDVTLEAVDLESQQKNLSAARDRLVELLSKAATATEALEVNRALVEVQGQLEQVQGRLSVLNQRVAMATLDVTFFPRASSGFATWRPLDVASNTAIALGVLARGLANLVIVLVVLTPAWAPVAFFVYRLRRRARSVAS